MNTGASMTASEASRELGVTRQTLYSYVSRGLVRSRVDDAGKRTRRYDAGDVRRLKERQETRRDPAKVVDGALDWGIPLRDSALTLIDAGHCYYRGKDTVDLARDFTVEQAAAWIWTEDERQADTLFSTGAEDLPPASSALAALFPGSTAMERFQVILPLAAAADLAAYDFRPRHVARTGARILRAMARLATYLHTPAAGQGLAETLMNGWIPDRPDAIALLRTALILCADHELNVSSFTARCVASAGSSPYAVVCAGLAALQGHKHGGTSERVEALFRETGTPDRAREALAQRIRRGDPVPGFGHPLYPDGDPRGRALLELAAATCPASAGLQLAVALADEGRLALHEEPNLDFGLCAVRAALELPPGAALTLFALGRTIGWIGHAIEEYQADTLIRPRARYTGTPPTQVQPA